MDPDEVLQRIRRAFELARDCVKRGEAPRALAHLHSVLHEIEDRPLTPEWAEYLVIYAGILASMKDEGAETAYNDAFKRISDVPGIPFHLQLRCHDDYGKHLGEKKSPDLDRAIRHSEKAREIAESLHQSEDAARLQLRVIYLDLRRRNDAILPDIQNLRKAAREDGYTAVEQLEAWIAHSTELEQKGAYIKGARNRGRGCVANVDYWRGRLSEVRRRLREPVH